jgi:signal transduction histidine kinase/phage shock protein PspC (stress-responsive transcriptional regulator)
VPGDPGARPGRPWWWSWQHRSWPAAGSLSVPTRPVPTRPGSLRRPRTRGRLTRAREGRVVAGVALGLARHLGVDPIIVRIGFVVLSFAGAVGLLLYGALWVLLPVERERTEPAPTHPDVGPSGRRVTIQQSVALGLITLGALLLLRRMGLWFGDALVFPIVLAAVGSAIVWTRSDADDRARLTRSIRLPGGRVISNAAAGPASPVRLIIGTLLVAGAVAGFLAANDALLALRDLGLALLAALIGVAMLFGPWLWRLGEQLSTERRERIRQEERAELAAHLHDSVLQTLALIQRSADHPQRMVTLARRQERELRAWLFSTPAATDADRTLAAAVTATAEEAETTHGVTVEVVTVGDAPMDDRASALVGAVREAVANAARHSGAPNVDVYLEVDDRELVAFVRDRGRGFDPASIPQDRQGIRSSIVDRLERHNGTTHIRSAPGQGTEIELSLPRRRTAANGNSDTSDNEVAR